MSSDTFGPNTLKSWKYKEVDGYLIKKVIGTDFENLIYRLFLLSF